MRVGEATGTAIVAISEPNVYCGHVSLAFSGRRLRVSNGWHMGHEMTQWHTPARMQTRMQGKECKKKRTLPPKKSCESSGAIGHHSVAGYTFVSERLHTPKCAPRNPGHLIPGTISPLHPISGEFCLLVQDGFFLLWSP